MFKVNFGNSRSWWILILVIGLMIATPSMLKAQEATGRVIGTVTDQQGAVIPNATVTVTNTAKQTSREVTTDKEGNFEVLSLPIGTYEVSAERAGFKKALSEPAQLQINQSIRFDIKLEVGTASETVTVTSQAATVETVIPTLGQTVQARQIVNLPLNGRNALDLALLQPGVSSNNPDDASAGRFNIAGGRSDSVTFLLDGGVNNNLLDNGVVYNPNPDTIAEFRLLTSNYTAEYGRNGGGIISVVTKSGTNSLHGSAFEFLRNDKFNANRFFNNRDGVPREVLKRNQYGFTIGGPVVIPKVVNGKDKYFFFAGFQGQRQVQTETSGPIGTFTPAELQGDFSHSGSNGGPDQSVVNFLLANPIYQPNPALAAQGIISRIDPVSLKYIGLGLIPTSSSGLITSQGNAVDNRDELTLRFDANVTPKNIISATLGISRNPILRPFSGSDVSGFPVTDTEDRRFANISYTKIFSPSVINDLRFTAQRSVRVQSVPARTLPSAADLGIGITPDHPTGPPRLYFNSGLTVGFSTQGPTSLTNNTFAWTDTLSFVKGKHGFKVGGGFSPYQNNTLYDFYVNGTFYFSGPGDNGGIGTGLLDDDGNPVYGTANDPGNDRADFLLGLPDELLQFGEAPSNIRSKSIWVFGQDEWKVRKNLTLTLGLRYEYNTPKFDTNGRSFSLKYGQRSTVFPNAPVGLLFPGDPGAPRGANFPDKNDFAPRFGFAYDPFKDGRTSIRGGFGVFYDILKGEDNLQYNGQAPFFGYADLFFSPDTNIFSQPFVNAGAVNTFPSRPPASNINFVDSGFTPFGGGGVYFVDPHLRTPYTYQYNLSIQRELVRNVTAEASYVGSASHKLTSLVDANPFILGTSNRIFNTQPGNTSSSFSYLTEFRNVASANYNSLQLSLTKQQSATRFFGTTYFTLAYTLAHSIDTASGFRNNSSSVPAYNTKLFRADSDFDVRQRLTFSGGWDLPFDRAWSTGPKRLVRGWSLYPIFTWQTGFPFDVLAGFSASRTIAGPSGAGDRDIVRANIVGAGPVLLDPRVARTFNDVTANYYFDPNTLTSGGFPSNAAAIANPALRTYGSLPRNAFRGPGRTNLDLALAKTTPLFGERLNMELRAEAFNIFNHPQFQNPDTSIGSDTFGQITTTYDPRIIQFGLRFSF